ncbi:hypothetical protein LPJ81_006275, partial [Coemansia sp. IMI 209127]
MTDKPAGKQGRGQGDRKNAKTGKSFRKEQIESLQRATKWVVKRLNSDRDVSAFAIEMKPSDPDFPYDVSRIYMAFLVPSAYPTARSSDDTISIHIANKDIPAGVKHNIESGFAKHARSTSNAAISAGNPEDIPSLEQYIDWLDTSLEALMQQKPAATMKFTTFADQNKQKTADKQQKAPALSNQRVINNNSSSSSIPAKKPHQAEVESKLKSISSNFNRAIPASRPPASRPVPESMLTGASAANAGGANRYADKDRRLTELWQLERRFRTSYNVLRDDSSEGTVVSINFAPTDPDLREYDIYKMTAVLTVSHSYPKPEASQDGDPSSPTLPAASLTVDPESISGCKSKESIWRPVGGRQAYIDYICHCFNEHVVAAPHTSLLHHLNWLDRHIVGMIASPPPTNWIQRQAPVPAATDIQQQQQLHPIAESSSKPKTRLFEEGMGEDKPWIKTISLEEAGLPEEFNNMQIEAEHDGTSDSDDDESDSSEASNANDKA